MLLVGVGGQGVVLAAEVLARAAIASGFDVTKSEVHGLAMRGGAVQSHVRFGSRVHSPLIPPGEADVLVAFEELEALRFADTVKPRAVAVVNLKRINPAPVAAGRVAYPDGIVAAMQRRIALVAAIDAGMLARQAGKGRSENFVLLGVLSRYLPLPAPSWQEGLTAALPRHPGDVNLRAFALGLHHVHEQEQAQRLPAPSPDTCILPA